MSPLPDLAPATRADVLSMPLIASFTCLADACPHTCCHGWQLTLTAADTTRLVHIERKAPRVAARLAEALRTPDEVPPGIDAPHGTLQFEHDPCPAMDPAGLCTVHSTLGDGALFQTCALFPRTLRDTPDGLELGTSLACPATAARAVEDPASTVPAPTSAQVRPSDAGTLSAADDAALDVARARTLRKNALDLAHAASCPAAALHAICDAAAGEQTTREALTAENVAGVRTLVRQLMLIRAGGATAPGFVRTAFTRLAGQRLSAADLSALLAGEAAAPLAFTTWSTRLDTGLAALEQAWPGGHDQAGLGVLRVLLFSEPVFLAKSPVGTVAWLALAWGIVTTWAAMAAHDSPPGTAADARAIWTDAVTTGARQFWHVPHIRRTMAQLAEAMQWHTPTGCHTLIASLRA